MCSSNYNYEKIGGGGGGGGKVVERTDLHRSLNNNRISILLFFLSSDSHSDEVD